jgi:RNA polymerase sigma-70 factor, ECF subfamily
VEKATDMQTPSSEELMLGVRDGDLDAFEQIVLRHQKTAWRIAYRFLGDAAEAEDVAQDAFLKLLAAAPRYRVTASFRTFFYRIVSRLCIDRARKMKPIYLDAVPDTPDPQPHAGARMASEERAASIRRVLNDLPQNQRMAVILRHYEELDYRAIAASMGITEKSVERLLARGRERMRESLASLLMDSDPEGDLSC